MPGPAKDLFGAANQAACQLCDRIHKTSELARRCREAHEREERRERARRFARTGVSQKGKP